MAVLCTSEPPRKLAPRDLQRRRGQRFLHEFANQLPNLQYMTVVNLDWITLPPHWSTHMVFGSYAGVRKFGLRGCHFSSVNTLRRMLSALPLLVHLSMQEVGWPPNRMPVLKGPENGFPRPALECLIIHGQSATYSALFEWLVNTPSQHTLKELWLQFACLPLYTGDDVLPLSQFSNLDLLRVEIIGDKDDTSYWLKVPPMLQDLRRGDTTMDLLDSFLQQPVFEKLLRVTFQVPGMNYLNAADNRKYRYTKLEALKKRLPKTAGRRILAVATQAS
ncbi:hypothetical protein VTO73DRAFT_2704 [Trametes versicolor]